MAQSQSVDLKKEAALFGPEFKLVTLRFRHEHSKPIVYLIYYFYLEIFKRGIKAPIIMLGLYVLTHSFIWGMSECKKSW